MTIELKNLHSDLEALSRIGLDGLRRKKPKDGEQEKSFLNHISRAVAEFFGVSDADAEKVGRKIARARLGRMKTAAQKMQEAAGELLSVIKEADDDVQAETGKGGSEMTKEEMKALLDEQLKPLSESVTAIKGRLDAVEAAAKNAAGDGKGGDGKGGDKPDVSVKGDGKEPVTAEAVKGLFADALKPIQTTIADVTKRLEGVEALTTKSRQDPAGGGDGKGGEKTKDPFGSAVREVRPALISSIRDRAAARARQ